MDHTAFRKKLGQNIKRIRIERGMTQVELGYACDLEKSSINRIEAGRTNATVNTLKTVADALEVSVEELFKTEKAKK